ncbi:MAG TPA: hypothetical protein DEG71_06290 [Clostridiales bacterium]|nr:hypothetical protein [Clostridiales bacterium]
MTYLITTRSGGQTHKTFTNKQEAEKYYNDNIDYNIIINKLTPFQFEGKQYYYSVGNSIAIYNKSFEYITKLKIKSDSNITVERIQEQLKEYINTWKPPY